MSYSGFDNFYLTSEQLQNLPSHRDGIDVESESALRLQGSRLIRIVGVRLRQPQVVMAAGQVLFHRFFCVTSFARYDVRRAAKACAWLASRLENRPARIRDVVRLYHQMDRSHEENHAHLRQDLHPAPDEFRKLEKDLSDAEIEVLRALGFCSHMDLPYKLLLAYLWELEASPELKQAAWNLANDSFLTPLCVRFRSHVVACGVADAAAR